MLALVLLAGCRCQDWADLAVEDPDGLATADDLAGIVAGIANMAAWTGRDETCVDEVRVVDQVFDDEHEYERGGAYLGSRIEIVDGLGERASAEITQHELCHAIDHEEGWISEAHADTLQALADEQDPDIYDKESERTQEAFATICAEGPVLPALYEALSAACGLDLTDPAVELVQELIFGEYDGGGEPGEFTHQATWTPLEERDGEAHGGSAARGGDAVYVLDHAGAESDGAYQVSPEILRVDSATRAVVERLALDPHPFRDELGTPSFWEHVLIGSSGDPILYASEGAWRVRPDPLTLEPLDFPRLDDGVLPEAGFEHDGLAYVYGKVDYVWTIALADLVAGTWTPVAADEVERFYGSQPSAFFADEEGAVAAFDAPGGVALVGFGWDGEIAWITPLLEVEVNVRALARLDGGAILAVADVWVTEDDGGATLYPLPILHDPEVGTWRIPDGDCSGGVVMDGWVVAGGHVVRAWPEQGDDNYVLELGELSLD